MPAGYTYLNLGSARSILAQRLQDTGLVFFGGTLTADLNACIVEAVRAWQAFTASYKQRTAFSTANATPFYDLTFVLSPGCLSYTVTDRDLVGVILSRLLEPPLTTVWTGTGQFTFPAIINALQARLNRFLGDTGVVITHTTQASGTAPVTRVYLDEGILDVRRAAWVNGSGVPTVLWRDDQFAMQTFRFSAAAQDPPAVYGMVTVPPVGVEVYPPGSVAGTLDLLVVRAGVTVGTTPSAVSNTPVVLGIPDDLAWAVTFGALSDLLSSDGPARDTARAAYCEQQYQAGVAVAKLNPTVMMSMVAGVPVWTGSVFELDAFQTSWQATAGPPAFVGMAGRNLAALGPVPNAVQTVTMDVVPNIPVPAADSDVLQADRGSLDAILDYAQHLASFPMGGAEFQATDKLRQSFMLAAAVENSRIRNLAVFQDVFKQPAQRQQAEVVRV